MIKAVIFDVDGTLLDSMHIWMEVGETYLKSVGIQPKEHLGETLSCMSLDESARYLKEHYRLSPSADEIKMSVLDVVRSFYEKEVQLKPGVKRFLEEIGRIPLRMVVATSSNRAHVEAAFHRLGIDAYFERIFTCEEAGVGKSNPAVFLLAADYLGFRPSEICVVEDALFAIRTANQAGFMTVGVYDGSDEQERDAIREESTIYLGDLKGVKKLEDSINDCRK